MLTPAELDSAVTFPSVSVWDLHTQTRAETLVMSSNSHVWTPAVFPQSSPNPPQPPTPPSARSFRMEQTSRLMLNNSFVHVEQCPRNRESHQTGKDEIFITQMEGLLSCTGERSSVSPSGRQVWQEKCWRVLGGLDHLVKAKQRLPHHQLHQQLKHTMTPLAAPFPTPLLLAWALWNGDCDTPVRTSCQAGVFALQVSDLQLRSADMKGLVDHSFNI